jgi:hypothetical protein
MKYKIESWKLHGQVEQRWENYDPCAKFDAWDERKWPRHEFYERKWTELKSCI